jgi:AcrR family transcriptional regulator
VISGAKFWFSEAVRPDPEQEPIIASTTRENASDHDTRRDALVNGAMALFAERGYSSTSVDDIGSVIGASGPALYWYFSSKESLLESALLSLGERELAGSKECLESASDPQDALRRLVAFHIDFSVAWASWIVVGRRERLALSARRRANVDDIHEQYINCWTSTLAAAHPGLRAEQLQITAWSVINLLMAYPTYLQRFRSQPIEMDAMKALISRLALGSLDAI